MPQQAPNRASDADRARDRADMDRLARGHDDALNDLMERHAGRLHGYLFRLLQDEQDARDLAQEAFVRVYEHRADFRPAHAFDTWLYTIATNLVRDRFRWRSRHPEVSLDHAGAPEAHGHAAMEDPVPIPGEQLMRDETCLAVRAAIASLPSELREPLVLAEFEERTHAEIATILDCSPKAVEMRTYRARQMLRRLLAPYLRE